MVSTCDFTLLDFLSPVLLSVLFNFLTLSLSRPHGRCSIYSRFVCYFTSLHCCSHYYSFCMLLLIKLLLSVKSSCTLNSQFSCYPARSLFSSYIVDHLKLRSTIVALDNNKVFCALVPLSAHFSHAVLAFLFCSATCSGASYNGLSHLRTTIK